VHITINGIEIPLQAARRNDDTFLLKFRPTIAGDYSIILKDFMEQTIPGCPFILPVYNPNVVHIESFNHLQSINDCHLICKINSRKIFLFLKLFFFSYSIGNIDKAGAGNIFIMVYSQINNNQFQPILIPIKIQSLPSNRIRISLSPSTIGIYRIYIAYRNIPINGKLSLSINLISTCINRS